MPKNVTLYHNPRCSNSRKALEVLRREGARLEVVEYLNNPPTKETVLELLKALGDDAANLVRANERAYAESGLTAESTPEEIAEALSKTPVLMQRPVCVCGDEVLIARPGDRARELFTDGQENAPNAFKP